MNHPADSEPRRAAQSPGNLATWLLLVGGLLATIAWVAFRGWSGDGPVPAEPEVPASSVYRAPPTDGYVGSASCTACHREIHDEFQSHPMSRSMQPVADSVPPVILPRERTRVPGNRRLHEVEGAAGTMVHHELMYDASGELIYDQPVSMDYVVGSGRRATAYLHQRGSVLLMSPLNWYFQSGQWDLAPGYEPDDPRRFDRRVTDKCVSCHSGRAASAGRSTDRFASPPFHEVAIGCENCHGPGKAHIDFHREGPAERRADPIVNPAHLDHARRESICFQCHLQPSARIPRYGRSEFDFRPGQRLDDIWTVLDVGGSVTADGRTEAIKHVQQMRESRCYTASPGQMDCTSCHDPHRVPSVEERPAFYRARCYTCHTESSCAAPAAERRAAEDSCIACHMPPRSASDMAHVSQTDHRIIRTLDHVAHGDATTLRFFDDQDKRLDEWERRRAWTLGQVAYDIERGLRPDRRLVPELELLIDRFPDDGSLLTVYAAIAKEEQRLDVARTYYERARTVPAAEEMAIEGLLDIYYLNAELDDALQCADRLLAINPGNARAHAIRADLLVTAGRTDEGIAAAERALEFDPTLAPVRQWLVEAPSGAEHDDRRRIQQQLLLRMQDARVPR